MSILIKGMEMPKHAVGVLIQPDGTVLDYRYGTLAGQAVPIPPHGDLIERDEILKDKVSNAYISRFEIDNAPTIIEADDKDINVPAKEEGE